MYLLEGTMTVSGISKLEIVNYEKSKFPRVFPFAISWNTVFFQNLWVKQILTQVFRLIGIQRVILLVISKEKNGAEHDLCKTVKSSPQNYSGQSTKIPDKQSLRPPPPTKEKKKKRKKKCHFSSSPFSNKI